MIWFLIQVNTCVDRHMTSCPGTCAREFYDACAHFTLRYYWNNELEASSTVWKRRVTPPNGLFIVKGFKQDWTLYWHSDATNKFDTVDWCKPGVKMVEKKKKWEASTGAPRKKMSDWKACAILQELVSDPKWPYKIVRIFVRLILKIVSRIGLRIGLRGEDA